MNNAAFNSPASIAASVDEYLTSRRRAGYSLRSQGFTLRSLARYAAAVGHRGPITLDLVYRWANTARNPTPRTVAGRIAHVRSFTRFCHLLDSATQVPPFEWLAMAYRRRTPHIYSPQEIRSLVRAAARWPRAGTWSAANYATVLGVLASTGLRISEALRLRRQDVDLPRRLLLIRETKFHKSRWVPIHCTTANALRKYAALRDRMPFGASTDLFFVNNYGRQVSVGRVEEAFGHLRESLGWRARGGHRTPRIHDLRFTFICRCLQRFYRRRVNLDKAILSLSTYVGHGRVSSTYWYLTGTPELMALAAQRFERFANRGAP